MERIKMDLQDALSASQAIDKYLADATITHSKCSYRLARNLRKLKNETKDFETKRDEFKKDCIRMDKGNPVIETVYAKNDDGTDKLDEEGNKVAIGMREVFKKGGEEKYKKFVEELLDEDLEVEIHAIPVSWLDGVEGGNQGMLFYHCEWMFEDDEPEE